MTHELVAHIRWHCRHCGTVWIIAGPWGRKYCWHTTIIRARWWQFRLWRQARFCGAMSFDPTYRAPIRAALRVEGFNRLLFTRIDPETLEEREVEVRG